MPVIQYCWKCQTDMAMLEDAEWAQIEPLLQYYVAKVKEARNDNIPFEKANKLGFDRPALELFYRLTGFREANIMNIWHHRTSLYGPPCVECGKPLRTPKARLCASCGAYKEIL